MYAKSIDRELVNQLMKKECILVDMRSPIEFRDGTIAGAVNLPLKNFLNTIAGLNKKTKIIVFGNSEEDADVTTGINYAARLGFNNLYVSSFNRLYNA